MPAQTTAQGPEAGNLPPLPRKEGSSRPRHRAHVRGKPAGPNTPGNTLLLPKFLAPINATGGLAAAQLPRKVRVMHGVMRAPPRQLKPVHGVHLRNVVLPAA